jgi:hypothetical protein
MRVDGDACARLELDEVQHRVVAEERTGPHARRELDRGDVREPYDPAAHQPASTGLVRSPIRSTETVTVSPGFM